MSMSAAEINLTPASTNFQAMVDGAPEGTTFRFSPGVYRNFSIQPKKGDAFQGVQGVSLNGSTVLTFRQSKPALWVADPGSVPPEVVNAGAPCDATLKNGDESHYTAGCTHSRSLYRNNAPLWRVATLQEVAPGKWYFDDSSKQAWVGDDPAGAVIELATMQDAFHGSAQNVVIADLTIEKYAGSQQHGAIDCAAGGSGWVISGNTIRLNHSRGIGFSCDTIRISGNRITTNGNLGIGGCCSKDALIENNEIDNNNYVHFEVGWEAGGVKTTRTTALVARKNNVHDNLGFGLWSDISAIFSIYDGNTVTNNSDGGILYEISHGASIIRNTVSGNGFKAKGKPGGGWLYYGQIIVSASDHVVVDSNTVTVGEFGNGITIVDQQRGSDERGLLAARDNTVINNKITYQFAGGVSGAGSDRDKVFENNNIFEDNTILGVNPSGHYSWNGATAAPDFKGK
jgi:parallel beta-helix repeat protein